MSLHRLRQEFQLKYFHHEHHNQRVFYCCQWRWPRPVFIVLRFLLATYTIYALIHLLIADYTRSDDNDNTSSTTPSSTTTTTTNKNSSQDKEHRPPFVYFTVWSYIVLMVHLTLAALLAALFYKEADVDLVSFKFPSTASYQRKHQSVALGAESPFLNGDNHQNTAIITGKNSSRSVTSTKVDVENPSFTSSNGHITSSTDVQHSNGKVDMAPETPSKELKFKEAQMNPNGGGLSSYESFSRFNSVDDTQSTRWYFKFSWVLSNIVTSAAPIVTIIFFVALFPQQQNNNNSAALGIHDINVHVLNLVFVIVDHMISARPIHLLHVVSPLLYGVLYITFSIIYWAVDNSHVIYPRVLDWNIPGVAAGMSLGLAFIAIPLIQMAFFGVFHLKDLIHRKLYGVNFDGELD